MSLTYHTERSTHLMALLQLVVAWSKMKLSYFTPEPPATLDDLWIPLRPAMRALRVPHASQRYLEQQLVRREDEYTDAVRWSLVQERYLLLLVSIDFFLTQVVRFGEHEACHTWNVWHTRVLSALMHHGWYDPSTNHDPPPGTELDAIERREDMQAKFDECFPWFKTLTRYRMVRDETGKVIAAEQIDPAEEERDDAE